MGMPLSSYTVLSASQEEARPTKLMRPGAPSVLFGCLPSSFTTQSIIPGFMTRFHVNSIA